ncbi:hypothetical protein FACS1894190_17840 [Spirochaetia bacterium]|nr:hypothetical protein FACS1894190_17840 [Spirochaetia bacterium]
MREEMRFEIKEIQKSLGITILYVTHDQEIALALSDDIAIMDENGSIIQIGSPVEIFEKPANDFIFKFLGVSNFLPVQKSGGDLIVGTQKMVADNRPTIDSDKFAAAFRPSDVYITRTGEGLKGKVVRHSFLGAITDYLIDVEGKIIRTQIDTYTAINDDLILKEGEECVLHFHTVTWFDKNTLDKEAV